MSQALASLVDRFAEQSVLVLGDALLDVYLWGHAARLSRDGPALVVELGHTTEAPGGGANAAMNLRTLGAKVTFLSLVGDDQAGWALREQLAGAGIDVEDLLVERGRRTPVKRRVLADGQLLVRLDEGDAAPAGQRAARHLRARLRELFGRYDAVLVADYAAGTIGPELLADMARLQAAGPQLLLVDARNPIAYRDVGVTAVKPNYDEAATLLGIDGGRGRRRAERLERDGWRLLNLLGAHLVAVTLDADGALLFELGRPPYRTYGRPVADRLATGAGDTFSAALTLALAAGADTPAAGEVASAAARLVVAREGTAACSQAALRDAVAGGARRVVDPDELAQRIDRHHQEGRRVVFTNGCFDLLHRGHVTLLNRAKSLGDVLVVGVNSDGSVRRLKGPDRPVNPLEDRLAVLAELSCVDYLVSFDDDTPAELIRRLRPDVFVKGGDYRADTVPEGPLVESLGGSVEILPYLEDRSTTGLIRRIRGRPGRRGAAAVPGG